MANLPNSIERQQDLGLIDQAMQRVFLDSATDLQRIEERVRSTFESKAPLLSEISAYILDLGGKRLRPLLTILSARLFGLQQITPALVDAAAGIELIHMASLLHDDIIDRSPLRRNKCSAFARWGLPPSLLTADFLLVRAFGLCARLDRFVIEATEAACIELTEGELLEEALHPQVDYSYQRYLAVVSRKTASLFALSASVGAHLAGADVTTRSCLSEFGRQAGIAFQMVDDILDVVADEDLLGKPTGTDLRQRSPSLVNILWLASDEPEARRFFAQSSATEEDCRRALEFLRKSSVIDQARGCASDYAKTALQHLAQPTLKSIDEEARSSLSSLVDYTLERCL